MVPKREPKRLRVLSTRAEPARDDAFAELARQAAEFEREMENGPQRSIGEEETGLTREAIASLVSEGIEPSMLRRVGRRLAELGHPRDPPTYRRLFERAQAHGIDVLEWLERELEIVD